MNDAPLCQLLRYSMDELVRCAHTDLTYIGDREYERSCLHKLRTQLVPTTQFEKRYLHRDQEKLIWTLVSVSLLEVANGDVYYLYQIYDVAERKEAESPGIDHRNLNFSECLRSTVLNSAVNEGDTGDGGLDH